MKMPTVEQIFGQPDLFKDDTIGEAFHEFHTAHPEVYDLMVRLARRARSRRPGQKVGAKALWERVRWDFTYERDPADEYKLNNNFTSRYARMMAKQEHDLSDAFEFRKLRAP